MPIINTPIIKSLKEEFKPYAEDIILNNLPMIDGLLLAHKKVLWGMLQKGTIHNKPFVKNIKNQGHIVEYYVYGDMPLSQVMVNMANNGMNNPYLQWDGNSGDKFRKDGKPASPRYTGARLFEYGEYMLDGIKKDAVPMKPNYDNSSIEPVIAPSIAPNIILNNSESIAVSEASKIPPHNVHQACDSIINYIKTKDIDTSIGILKCPDFCNGGKIIYEKDTFDKIYKTGKGSFSLVGKYNYNKRDNVVLITEVPYSTNIDAIESAIEKHYKLGKFKEVNNVRNASGKDGLKLEIKVKKNINIDIFEKQLRKLTPFESKYSCNFTVLGLDYVPYLMNLEGVYITYVQHRINCIKNETQFDINKNNKELNKLKGLEIINKDLDTAIKLIRSSKSEKEALQKLLDYFNLNQEQVEYISNIRLPNLNQEWIFKKIKNIEELEQENIKLIEYYNSEKMIEETIVSQLEKVKQKYGQPRKTEIIYPSELEEITKIDLVEDYNPTLVLTSQQYIKKIRKYTDKQKLKENDFILQYHQCNNKDDLLMFTSHGRMLIRKIHELPECDSPSKSYGEFIPNLIGDYLQEDEKIIYITTTKKWNENLICVFENGNVSKMSLTKYKPKQNRQVPIEDIYNTESLLLSIMVTKDDIDALLVTQSGHGLIINTNQINAVKSKNGKGNVGIKLDIENMEDDKVIASILDVNTDISFNLITEKKKEVYMLLSDVSPNENKNVFSYLQKKRGALGSFIYNTRSRKDKIVSLKISQ